MNFSEDNTDTNSVFMTDNASDTTSDEKTNEIGRLPPTIDVEPQVSDPHIVRAKSKYLQHTPKQQQEIAQDMFSQMKQLKAHNEVMGYHGFSGLLQRHDSNMNITDNIAALAENPDAGDDHDSDILLLRKHRNRNAKHVTLAETQPLRQKLEDISGSISKIRHDLQNQSIDKISTEELNETINAFHTQLTEIQDRIEDAEVDIELNIDVKFIKYQEEIQLNKQKIKTLKKEKKDKEKQVAVDREKEQQKIIDLQRTQIDQLIRGHSQSATMLHTQFSSETQNTLQQHTPQRERGRSRSRHTIDTTDEEEDDEDEEESYHSGARPSSHIQNGTMIVNNVPKIDKFMPMVNSPGSHASLHSPFRDEGHFKYQHMLQLQLQQQQLQLQQPQPQPQAPLLSDNAIKIIGGVALGLSVIWILSKYIDGKGKGDRMAIYRPPRLKY